MTPHVNRRALGKAMDSLPSGTGTVRVLVTLQ